MKCPFNAYETLEKCLIGTFSPLVTEWHVFNWSEMKPLHVCLSVVYEK